MTGLEFKLKATVAREKAECRIQLFPRLRLRPKSKSRTLTWKKIAAPCVIFYSRFAAPMAPAISAINVCSNFKKIEQSRRNMKQLRHKRWQLNPNVWLLVCPIIETQTLCVTRDYKICAVAQEMVDALAHRVIPFSPVADLRAACQRRMLRIQQSRRPSALPPLRDDYTNQPRRVV